MSDQPNRLSAVVSARLVNLLEAEYTASGLPDKEFAAYATEKLGTPVTESSVAHRRRLLGIEPLQPKRTAPVTAEEFEALRLQCDADRKEAERLTALVMELKRRLELVEKAMGLKGHFRGEALPGAQVAGGH